MFNIYAQTFMTASRSGCVRLRDVPRLPAEKRLGWPRRGTLRCIDPAKL